MPLDSKEGAAGASGSHLRGLMKISFDCVHSPSSNTALTAYSVWIPGIQQEKDTVSAYRKLVHTRRSENSTVMALSGYFLSLTFYKLDKAQSMKPKEQ